MTGLLPLVTLTQRGTLRLLGACRGARHIRPKGMSRPLKAEPAPVW
jgi:hypothetical protein